MIIIHHTYLPYMMFPACTLTTPYQVIRGILHIDKATQISLTEICLVHKLFSVSNIISAVTTPASMDFWTSETFRTDNEISTPLVSLNLSHTIAFGFRFRKDIL